MTHPTTAGELLRQRIQQELELNGVELDNRELSWLDQACAIADLIASLEAKLAEDGPTLPDGRISPVVVELRLSRESLLRFTKSLDLTGNGASSTAASAHGRAAANKRWAHRGVGR